MSKILDNLKKMQDKKYAEFQVKLIPTVDKKTIIGTRTPELKKYAKELLLGSQINVSKNALTKTKGMALNGDVEKFLNELPHKYFDENQLHAFILSEIKDFDICIKRVDEFLPYVDNWATCDQLSPKVFKKHKEKLLKYINKWIKSKKAFIVRFAIGMLMQHFLDEDFDKKYLNMVSDVKFGVSKVYTKTKPLQEKISVEIDPDKYYVEMMRAWFFATALSKKYKETFPYIKNKALNTWTHNKVIQKAVESYRVSDKNKAELKKYRI